MKQLIPRADGNGRRAAVEIMLNTPLAADLIRKGNVPKLKELMKRSNELGMVTFDQSFLDLYRRGLITEETAISQSDKPADMEMKLRKIKFDKASEDDPFLTEKTEDNFSAG